MRILSPAAVAAMLMAVAGPSAVAQDGPKVVVNVQNGLALAGYDPVSYFSGSRPAKGSPDFTATHLGATYRFVSAANRDRFVEDPTRYAPQFGGYCGYGASRGYLAPVDPEAYTIMAGRLILQNSKRVLELWQKEPDARLELADRNWPGIVAKEGKVIR
jgi:YHS domain-containing protein